MLIVGEDLVRAFYKLFCLSFVVHMIGKKTLCRKGFTSSMRDNFTIFAILVTISLLSSFCPFLEIKKKNQIFQQVGDVVTRNISIFCL